MKLHNFTMKLSFIFPSTFKFGW